MKITELKVKRMTLGAEVRIIKLQEHKALKRARIARDKQRPDSVPFSLFLSLQQHRRFIVRPAARAAHLAHTFLRGKSYATVENKKSYLPYSVTEEFVRNVKTFGGITITMKQAFAWIEDGWVLPVAQPMAA